MNLFAVRKEEGVAMSLERKEGSSKRLAIIKKDSSVQKKVSNNKDDGIVGRKSGETKVCTKCGRIFTYMGFGHLYCPTCKSLDEISFGKVRDYIYENGVASATEVSENTGVSVRQIEQYLREGRLEIPENSPIFIKCEMCHADIRSGRICSNCGLKLSNVMRIEMDIDEFQIGEKPKTNGKMRFLNKDNDIALKVTKRK